MLFRSKKTRELITQRVGFHYFPDTTHYTNKDLSTWLPILRRLQASWLVLQSDTSRAIPEQFISSLIKAKITPIVHFSLPLPNSPSASDMKAILGAYSRWGVRHVMFFDRPNDISSWTAAGWVQQNLVERFIDRFLPLANTATQLGMTPIFPPLQPGGSYWDLTFLKQSLQSLQRRGFVALIKQMGLAAYAFTFNHELEFGAGGPAKWPGALPYVSDPQTQNQIGFRNFEWVQAVACEVTGFELPLYMFGAGIKEPGLPYSPEVHAGICLSILETLKVTNTENAIPGSVKCCNFFLLSADPESEEIACAWFKSAEEYLPIVDLIIPSQPDETINADQNSAEVSVDESDELSGDSVDQIEEHPIEHYILLPVYEWGIADFHLDVIRPFVQKYHPAIGFSIQEAALARQVTVIGGDQTFPEDVIEGLRKTGSIVDRISGDGTSIATQLSER